MERDIEQFCAKLDAVASKAQQIKDLLTKGKEAYNINFAIDDLHQLSTELKHSKLNDSSAS
ncbi:MAG: hypothetical protein CMN34_05790 [Saprospirales bacterium]|nr:hypothetical protein [Saprospirales bacterium]|tara:strand:+ start:213 stop:395 length:183 start_codon:yes stop_codon:yes gene_type:complete